MKIGAKLIIGFLIIAIITGVVGIYSIILLRNLDSSSDSLFENYGNSQGYLGFVLGDFQSLRVYLRELQISPDSAADVQTSIEAVKLDMTKYLSAFEKTCITEDQKKMYTELEADLQAFNEIVDQVAELTAAGKMDEVAALKTTDATVQTMKDATTAINNAVQSNVELANLTLSEQKSSVNNNVFILIAVVAASVVAAVLLGIFLSRAISRPIKKMVAAADKMAAGDMDIDLDIKSKDEVGMLTGSFDSMISSIRRLIGDANMLSDAAVAGEFDTRADAEKHQGDYRKIVEGVNATLDTVVEKVFWYESLLDSIPFPISVTDMDMNWTFINKPVEQMLQIKRRDVLGTQCDNWNANICSTENCGIARLRKGQLQTEFLQNNMNFQVDTTYIYDTKGEKVGHIELVQDITAKAHSAEYSANEVAKLANNLKQLKEGNLKLEFHVGAGDQYTQQEKENFEEINRNFKEAVETISGYIDELSFVLGRFADRDLTQEITSEYRGDFITLKESINHIMQAMNELLLEINIAADQVSTGSNQVSQGNQAISQGATEQAASIEELTASLTQVAEQTHENAQNSKKSNEMALDAKKAAVEGNDQMKEMLKSMEEINESSENISKIIKVIDDIAFQTNILALNAAVEAARAGVHGKGFAVVAEEVRNLAARSANAARETTDLIEGSIKIVGTGTRIAQSTADALEKIVGSVNKTVELGEGIAIASVEQAAGISQINQGVEQMSQVVQTNSATAQEGAAASEELSGQAELLKEKISSFNLKKGQEVGQKKKNTYEEIVTFQKELTDNNDKY